MKMEINQRNKIAPPVFGATTSLLKHSDFYDIIPVIFTLTGGDPVSTGYAEVRSRVVDPRWPRKKRGKKVIANNDYALAA